MITKWIKWGAIGTVSLMVVGGLLFGRDWFSYLRSSAKITQDKVKDAVPIEFELQRAQCLLDEILPEIQANIRMISQEEVELVNLKKEIEDSQKAIADQKSRVQKLRSSLDQNQEQYQFNGRKFTRQEITEELAMQFDNLKESELVLASKNKLYENREKSLQAGMQLLDKTKSQKRLLASKIEGLEGKYRLLKASAVGSGIQIDNSKMAQTEKLIDQIKKRLDVSERVLAHESKFVETMNVTPLSDQEVMGQVDEYFAPKPVAQAEAVPQQQN